MGNIFGVRRRAPVVTKQDRAILQLKQQRDKIKIYQKKVGADLEANRSLALDLFEKGLKDRAIVVLRRKKQMDDIISRTDKQLETLEQLISDIEYTQIEVSVVEGLKVGTEALKQLNSLMNIDDIQRLMDDNEEAAEKQREISDVLSRSTGVRYDESELLEELRQLEGKKEAEELDQKLSQLPEPSKEEPVASEPAQTEEPEQVAEQENVADAHEEEEERQREKLLVAA